MTVGIRDALLILIAKCIEEAPIELDGFRWCGMPQSEMATALQCSVETLRRLISKPPIVRKRRMGMTLLRVGEPGPQTHYDLAQIMSAIFRKKTGRRTNVDQFNCLLGLAGEWPDGLQVELFKIAMTRWPEFMAGVNVEAQIIRRYEFPSISVIRRFHHIAVQMMTGDYQESGKEPPPALKALNPGMWPKSLGLKKPQPGA
jgi:hypothetical protein